MITKRDVIKRMSFFNKPYYNTLIKAPSFKSNATKITFKTRKNDKHYSKITKGDSTYWFPDQVRFILQPNSKSYNYYGKAFFRRKDHTTSETDYFYDKGTLILIDVDIFKKIPSVDKAAIVDFSFYSSASFTSLSDSTNYLSLPTFSWNQKIIIDSLLTIHEKELNNKPYLIIDLRNNPGGYSHCFSKILPLIYSKPIVTPPTYFLASAENIQLRTKMYEKYFTSDTSYNNELKKNIVLMQKSVGTRMKLGDSDTTIIQKVLPNPKKIVILTDKGSISAAEDLVFYAQKSDKVVTMGDNTGGVYNSLDVMATRYLPSLFFQYRCPTVELVGLPNINTIGFAPDIRLELKNYNHWVSIAQKFLEKL